MVKIGELTFSRELNSFPISHLKSFLPFFPKDALSENRLTIERERFEYEFKIISQPLVLTATEDHYDGLKTIKTKMRLQLICLAMEYH